MEQIKQIEANGISFAYFEMGEGPLVLCIHGFPDTAVTWHDTMHALARDGFRVIAPYTRGYPPTSAPANNSYTPLDLGSDILALIDAFDEEQAVVIGHDWGAMAAYTAAHLAPEKIRKLVTVAIPHPRSLRFSISTIWAARHFLTFQRKKATVRKFRQNEFAFVDEIYRRWSPGWNFPESETAPTKVAFAKPGGIEAALGYYWSFASTFRNKAIQRVVNRKTAVPTLTIVGANDGALDVTHMPGTEGAFMGPYRYEILANAGHFPHREQPELFLAHLRTFLNKRTVRG